MNIRITVRATTLFAAISVTLSIATIAVIALAGWGVHRTSAFAPETGVTTSTGFSNQLIDQPLPFPAIHPAMAPDAGCEWLIDAMPALSPLQLTNFRRGLNSPACQLWGSDISYAVQVRSGSHYTAQETAAQLDPITIAGVHGRRYVLDNGLDSDPSFCSIELDVRAFSTVSVDAFDFDESNPDAVPTSPDNKANCARAERVADILARRYVPLAGGSPWPSTPQRPDVEELDKLKPCGLIEDSIYSELGSEVRPTRGDTRLGTTCTYRNQHGALEILITTGASGLDRFPRQFAKPPYPLNPLGVTMNRGSAADSRVREDIRFGDHYRAREEHSPAGDPADDRSCVVALETDNRRVIAITYTSRRTVADNCAIARINMAHGMLDAVNMVTNR